MPRNDDNNKNKASPPPPDSLNDIVPPGVVSPDNLQKLLRAANECGYTIPSFQCDSSTACNNAMASASSKGGFPIIIRTTFATCRNYAGDLTTTTKTTMTTKKARHSVAAAAAVALALHVRSLAPHYQLAVILQTETHCLHQLVHWYFDHVYRANEAYFCVYQEPLFSSHRIVVVDSSASSSDSYHNYDHNNNHNRCTGDGATAAAAADNENNGYYSSCASGVDPYYRDEIIPIAKRYLERFHRLRIWLELALLIVVPKEEKQSISSSSAASTSSTPTQSTARAMTWFGGSSSNRNDDDCSAAGLPWVTKALQELSQVNGACSVSVTSMPQDAASAV